MSNTNNRKPDLSGLLDKYKNISVVSEIEKNLAQAQKVSYPAKSLYLSDFYDERNYDLKSFPQLEESLRKEGFLIPLIIVKGRKEGTYEIINGVKRYLFAKEMAMQDIPCVLAEISPERKIAYLVENIIGEGGCALTKTTCFVQMRDVYHYDENQIAQLSGMSLSQVKNLIRLDTLPDFLKEAIRTYQISYGLARSLLNLPLEEQEKLFHEILTEKLSVRDIEAKKRLYRGTGKNTRIRKKQNKITLTFDSSEKANDAYQRLIKEFQN